MKIGKNNAYLKLQPIHDILYKIREIQMRIKNLKYAENENFNQLRICNFQTQTFRHVLAFDCSV